MKNTSKEKDSCWERITNSMVTFFETLFYRHGKFVATHPVKFLVISLIICLLGSLGFINIKMESKPERLWIPQDSDFVRTLEWQKKNHPENLRSEIVLLQADNVLDPVYIKQMFELKLKIQSLVIQDSSGKNQTQNDLCYRVPAVGGEIKSLMGSQSSEGFDWSQYLDRESYCHIFDVIPNQCLNLGILDMWTPSASTIDALTQEDIIRDINQVNTSATFSIPLNFTSFLGGITRNSSGHIVGAKASLHIWIMQIDRTKIANGSKNIFSPGLTSDVNPELFAWEGLFVKTVLEKQADLKRGAIVLPFSLRSFVDISEQAVFGDVQLLSVGIIILLAYVTIMLGKCNCVEMRPVLAAFGFVSIALSVLFSFGLCAGMGLTYGPIHSLLPLIFCGLGVDDMFVVVRSLETFYKSNKEANTMKLQEKMGIILSRSGVAITVTSLTNFMAFGIGASTTLPALQSFCIYAAVGILSLYLMMITFFFAALTLDQMRLEADRNGCLWFLKHRQWEANQCSQFSIDDYIFGKIFSRFLLKKWSKILVIVITTILTSICIWGVTNLRQEFSIIRFYPKSSHVSQVLKKITDFYPEKGHGGTVFIEQIDLPHELGNLKWLTENMKESKWISKVDTWYDYLVSYTLSDTGVNMEEENVTNEFFLESLGKFLFSPSGLKFQHYFYFNDSLNCTEKAPKILACKFKYLHHTIKERDDQIQAMDDLRSYVNQANFSGFSTFTSVRYIDWETNRYILHEVIQNLSLAMAAVFLMTAFLILDLRSSVLVLFSVLLTLVDVMALMCWWDLTINTVTCINLVLTVGLSVDYAAHVALHFMQVKGSRDERVTKTLTEVGPPVFHGAFATFLSLSLLAKSDSYVFESFFKIFFGVFVFGMYHGMVFLPVILSLIGSPSYRNKQTEFLSTSNTKTKSEQGAMQLTTYSFAT